MWPELEKMIQNGQGNRHLDFLNAIGILHQRCHAIAGDALDTEFDSVIAQFATELDRPTAEALSCHADAARFPMFCAALKENMLHGQGAPDSRLIVADIEGQPVAKVERRSRPRDQADEQNNPISLARRASQEELLQIAALPSLPEALSNVLISRGNREVLERVLRNPSAIIARSSLTTLAELAPSDRLIKNALADRFDLPEPIVDRLLPFLPKAQKARLLLCGLAFNFDHCSRAMSDANEEVQTAQAAGQAIMTVPACLHAIEQGSATISEVIILMARETRVAELSAIAAARLGLGLTAAFNAFSGRLDHAAVVLMRALDCEMTAVDEVMQMRRRLGCREARETRSAQVLAQRYSLAAARELALAFEEVASDAGFSPMATKTFDIEDLDAIAA
jgi:hypothetical protein